MKIPAAALEAATAAIEVRTDKAMGLNDLARGILEAAAPYLAAEAWDQGEAAGRSYAMRLMSDEPHAPKPTNPHRFMKGPA